MAANLSTEKHKWLFIFCLFVFLMITKGCAWPYGQIQSSTEVTKMFRTNTVPKEYHYYYDGHSDRPYVIIGLHPEFKLVSRFWDPVKPNTEDFERKVQGIYRLRLGIGYHHPEGSFILDAKGDPVGIWYSMYRQTGVIVNEDKSVFIYSPHRDVTAANPGFYSFE